MHLEVMKSVRPGMKEYELVVIAQKVIANHNTHFSFPPILTKQGEPELSVYDLCEAVNLARTQVNRKVKALSGKSPTLYIRAIRLEKAKELLQATHLTISEIAYDVGFNDPGYFTRVFHEAFGETPSQIREIDKK